MLVARSYTERITNIGLNEEPLDCLFLLRQSDNVLQSTYNAFSSVLEGTTLNNEFVGVSTFGFMNKRVKKLSNQYKWEMKKTRGTAITQVIIGVDFLGEVKNEY
ncbi:hypothetical protein NW48_14975 [Listeria monocytogenes]|nr:hypothetical protein [Listeria monocytogenes]